MFAILLLTEKHFNSSAPTHCHSTGACPVPAWPFSVNSVSAVVGTLQSKVNIAAAFRADVMGYNVNIETAAITRRIDWTGAELRRSSCLVIPTGELIEGTVTVEKLWGRVVEMEDEENLSMEEERQKIGHKKLHQQSHTSSATWMQKSPRW